MEAMDLDIPLPFTGFKVGVLYNLKKGVKGKTDDCEAEYDSIDTVHAICNALQEKGAEVLALEAGPELVQTLQAAPVDIAFNIAEGFCGRGREAQIPALLNMMGIPFTGSDETALCVALDKALAKRLLSTYHIRTPHYAVITEENLSQLPSLHYPVIVKPNAEGSSKGISGMSVVQNAKELRALCQRNFDAYEEEMLAEEYVEGREFTVGLLGNGTELRAFSPMEIIYKQPTQGSYHVYDYTVKQDYTRYVSYQCPAALSPAQEQEMIKASLRAFRQLGCKDFARADFRMDAEGKCYFIELNPLPGLAPNYSDYPMLADFCGVSYSQLVCDILQTAIKRCGLRKGA
ncbi:MAG: ATP-grasp domain-containing protein [Eubacteriales bacterium]|nr:ATP-grasp domain-containing protein [Eubacteriales bacterium]